MTSPWKKLALLAGLLDDSGNPPGGPPSGDAGGDLEGTYPDPTVAATHAGSTHHDPVTVGTGLDVTGQLVELDLSEVAAGGELGGFMDAPTVDATHSGSSHAATQAAAEATASGALATHAGSGHIALGATEPGAVSTTSSGTAGSGSTASKVDHSHDLGFDDATADPAAIGTTADGTATSAARKDHVHATGAGTPSTQAFGDAAATGTGPAAAMTDHKHAMPALGTGATNAAAGNDARLSDARTPTAHASSHLPTGSDAVNKFSQSAVGTLDAAIANTETVVVARTFAANELVAGQMYRFEAWGTKAGTQAAAATIRIRIGTTTLTGNIAGTLTTPNENTAVPWKIEGLLRIVTDGAGGTARGEVQFSLHLGAVTLTSAIGPSTGTVAVDTTAANQKVELTFISGHASNTYTFRNAVMYRVA